MSNFTNISTVPDLEKICRICLQSHEEMVDIFESGMDHQFLEITSLQVERNDELPKVLCLNCICQVDCFYKFLHQAKTSDKYLKSILLENKEKKSKESPHHLPIEKEKKGKERSPKKRLRRRFERCKNKKRKKEIKNDKMYLIFVPNISDKNSEVNNQICIQDLNSSNENSEISEICKTLVKSYFSANLEQKYLKELNINCSEGEQNNHTKNLETINEDSCNQNKIYSVNMGIYKCYKCSECFEESNDLINHHLILHNCQPPLSQFIFRCPVCFFEELNKNNFLKHLEDHKIRGISFIKVNECGEKALIKESESHLFERSYSRNKKSCKIFKINLQSIKCCGCLQNFDSEYSIQKHLLSCSTYKECKLNFNINFLCPVCNKSLKDEKSFLSHLALHQNEDCYFVMVNSVGEPVNSTNEIFLPVEEAFEILEFFKGNTSTKFFKIINTCSCDKCDYESESFNLLYDHYNVIHGEKISEVPLFSCPVCLIQHNKGSLDDNMEEFLKHLKEHKKNGFYFISVKRNGSFSTFHKIFPDIFIQSPVLCNLINNDKPVISEIWCPELVISNPENLNFKYSCDLCQKHFKKKQDIIKHMKSHNNKKLNCDTLNFICETCGKICSSKESYKKHFFKHSTGISSVGKRPKCSICHKTFANRGTLNGHLRHHLKEGVEHNISNLSFHTICEKCGQSFSNNASLAKHKKLHTKDKENSILKCEICNRDFLRQTSFDRHKSAHLNPNYFECEICKLPLSSVLSLQKHSESHQNGSNTYDCKACKISFLTKDSLNAHQAHTGHYLDRKPFECNVCHEKFFITKKFTEHIKTHPKYKMGECALCGKKLATLQSLMLHMSRHFESNCILCPHCGNQFYEKKNYHRHLLSHEGVKPFSCDVETCEKSFYTIFELNRHKKYHNNTRNFGCSYCSKSFHEANHLTVHIRTHTGERPYKCPHCNKAFVTRTRCKHHIKLNHQGVGYDLIQSAISKKVTVFETVNAV